MTTPGYFQVSLSSFTLRSKFSAFAIFFPILSSHFSVTCVPKSSASCRGYIKPLFASLAVDLLLPKPPFAHLQPHHQTSAICHVHTEVSDLQPQSRSTGAEHLKWQLPPDTDWHRAETGSNTWVHWFAQAAFPKGCLVPSASSHMAALGSMFS